MWNLNSSILPFPGWCLWSNVQKTDSCLFQRKSTFPEIFSYLTLLRPVSYSFLQWLWLIDLMFGATYSGLIQCSVLTHSCAQDWLLAHCSAIMAGLGNHMEFGESSMVHLHAKQMKCLYTELWLCPLNVFLPTNCDAAWYEELVNKVKWTAQFIWKKLFCLETQYRDKVLT